MKCDAWVPNFWPPIGGELVRSTVVAPAAAVWSGDGGREVERAGGRDAVRRRDAAAGGAAEAETTAGGAAGDPGRDGDDA